MPHAEIVNKVTGDHYGRNPWLTTVDEAPEILGYTTGFIKGPFQRGSPDIFQHGPRLLGAGHLKMYPQYS